VSSRPALLQLSGVEVLSGERILEGIDLEIQRGERVGLLGASGAGKSLTVMACMGLTPAGLSFDGGRILIDGVDILRLPERERSRLRGKKIGTVFQESLNALNPVWSIGFQLRELIRLHRGEVNPEEESRRLLRTVGLKDMGILRSFPHQLSGGQRRRVLLAMAMAPDPKLILADEITASLDFLSRAAILDLLDSLCSIEHRALLLVTHDLEILKDHVDRVLVMENGFIIEESPTTDFFAGPLHPMSRRMLDAAHGALIEAEEARENILPGSCPAAPVCPDFITRCEGEIPLLRSVGDNRKCRCFFAEGDK